MYKNLPTGNSHMFDHDDGVIYSAAIVTTLLSKHPPLPFSWNGRSFAGHHTYCSGKLAYRFDTESFCSHVDLFQLHNLIFESKTSFISLQCSSTVKKPVQDFRKVSPQIPITKSSRF